MQAVARNTYSEKVPQVRELGEKQALSTSPGNASETLGFSYVMVQALEKMAERWGRIDTKTKKLIQRIPEQQRPLMELQLLAHQLQIETEVISRTAETVNSTVRRVHQLAGN